MPELPEVETIKRQLTKHLPGLTLEKVLVHEPKLRTFLDPAELTQVIGQRLAAVERRAKVLLWRFENNHYLAFHLKMTGQVVISNRQFHNTPGPSNRATLIFSDQTEIYFRDWRKFGWIKVLKAEQLSQELFRQALGPEPFSSEFTVEYFQSILNRSNKPIKVLLLEQSLIAGIGNIYANEALFLAGIDPRRRSRDLKPNETAKLYQTIKEVLEKGINLGGASDNSYLNAYGRQGQYQNHFLVYRRQNRPCVNCQHSIVRVTLGGRGTFYCPHCQV